LPWSPTKSANGEKFAQSTKDNSGLPEDQKKPEGGREWTVAPHRERKDCWMGQELNTARRFQRRHEVYKLAQEIGCHPNATVHGSRSRGATRPKRTPPQIKSGVEEQALRAQAV